MALVDQVLNSNFPCADGNVAAAGADSLHSGVAQGSSSVVTYDTTGMSTAKTFAVCYTEGDGTSSASWVDSAIRITVAKVSSIEFGNPARILTNIMASSSTMPKSDTIVSFTYVGVLTEQKQDL